MFHKCNAFSTASASLLLRHSLMSNFPRILAHYKKYVLWIGCSCSPRYQNCTCLIYLLKIFACYLFLSTFTWDTNSFRDHSENLVSLPVKRPKATLNVGQDGLSGSARNRRVQNGKVLCVILEPDGMSCATKKVKEQVHMR